jgi:hypothetical protein
VSIVNWRERELYGVLIINYIHWCTVLTGSYTQAVSSVCCLAASNSDSGTVSTETRSMCGSLSLATSFSAGRDASTSSTLK